MNESLGENGGKDGMALVWRKRKEKGERNNEENDTKDDVVPSGSGGKREEADNFGGVVRSGGTAIVHYC